VDFPLSRFVDQDPGAKQRTTGHTPAVSAPWFFSSHAVLSPLFDTDSRFLFPPTGKSPQGKSPQSHPSIPLKMASS